MITLVFPTVTGVKPVSVQMKGAGNGACVARINKSRFVIDLVENYGFRFGDWQDVATIRIIAENEGYLDDFERGYSL